MDDAVSDLVKDINKLRLELGDTRSKGETVNEELLGKLSFMRRLVEELREKTWELDTNTRNNLVIYGIKEEGNPGNTEWAVKEVRHQEFFSLGRNAFLQQMIRNYLHISRDLPFRKCHRHQEPDAKGIRPVTVQFEKHAVNIIIHNKSILIINIRMII